MVFWSGLWSGLWSPLSASKTNSLTGEDESGGVEGSSCKSVVGGGGEAMNGGCGGGGGGGGSCGCGCGCGCGDNRALANGGGEDGCGGAGGAGGNRCVLLVMEIKSPAPATLW